MSVVFFQMAVIFNKEGLKDLMPPCVVQQFVNHNAVLFKVMILLDVKSFGLKYNSVWYFF